MWINISISLKKLETFDKFPAFLVVLVLANAIVEGIKGYYEKKESKV